MQLLATDGHGFHGPLDVDPIVQLLIDAGETTAAKEVMVEEILGPDITLVPPVDVTYDPADNADLPGTCPSTETRSACWCTSCSKATR